MTESPTATTGEDYEALRAERDELRALLAAMGPAPSRHRTRTVVSALFVALACLAFLGAMPGLWANRNLLDTDRFVSRVGPLVEEPEVQGVLATRLTEQVMVLVDPRELFVQVLPERGQLLAVPLANAVEGFVRDRVASFVATDAFERLWIGAATVAHRAALGVLRGDSDAVVASDGQVTLNLVPAINAVLARITSASPEILGREVDLPEVSVEDVPEAAIQRIEAAFDVELDEDFGQLTVYDHGRLRTAQQWLDAFSRVVVLLLPAAILAAVLALWVSTRRRRTLLQLCAGAALAAVLVRRVIFGFDDDIVALARQGDGRRAAATTIDAFLSPLTTFAAWTVGVAAVVAAVALVTGPWSWAVGLRSRVASVVRTVAAALGAGTADRRTQGWIRERRDLLTGVLAVVGGVALWVLDLSWSWSLLVAAVLGACILVVRRVGAADAGTDGAADDLTSLAPH